MAKITIFGLAGTGKTTVGKMVAEELGYEYMSTGNIYREMAKEHGMTLNEFQTLTESDEKYDRELDEIKVANYGREKDNFVFESRLAWNFIPDSIKIRLFCNDEERLKRIAGRENKNVNVVKEETEHREKSIYKTYKKLYGIENIDSPENFDLNIDTQKINVKQVTEIIIDFVKNKTK